jgi:hypothetical protein
MIPYHRVTVSLPKTMTLGDALERLAEAEGPPQEFWGRGQTDTSTLPARAVKAIPGLAPFVLTATELGALDEGWRTHVATEVGGSAEVLLPANPARPTLAELVELAHGVPRRFPASDLLFAWRHLPWLGAVDEADARTEPFDAMFPYWLDSEPDPALILYRSGSSVVLDAWVRAGASPDGKKPPTLPAVAQERLARLGKVKDLGLLPRLDATYVSGRAEINRRMNDVIAAFDEPTVALPHRLPPQPESRDLNPLSSNHRDEADRLFRPLGYKPFAAAGSTGCIAYEKRSTAGNRLLLQVDYGTRVRRVSVTLTVIGVGWSRWLPVNFGPRDRGTYAVNDEATYTQILENSAVLLVWLEREAVPLVDAAYPPTPTWWKLPATAS